jgi:hypothetical protein
MARLSHGTRGAVHTTPNPAGAGWVTQVNGHILSTHRFKERAEESGRIQAQRRETEHVIHGRQGEIQERNSYGNDPPERKG